MTGPESTPSSNNIPQFSSRYELLARLGTGGKGAVFKARDNVLDKIVAVKLLLPSLNSDAAIRFQNEARSAAKLEHPNIVGVLDFGQTDKSDLYLIMEFIEGISLENKIKQSGPLDINTAIDIFCQICSGLQHAHSQHILHRDIKPSNIMLCRDDADNNLAKIVDFGLAKLEHSEQKVTATGVQVGSPMYMSPEQSQGHDVDARSDIYSLGCLMFFTLTGRPPLKGETYMETIMKQVEELPPKLNDQFDKPKFPAQMEAIVDKALHKDPSQRYQSAEQLMQAILLMSDELESAPPMVLTVSGESKKKPWRIVAATIVAAFVLFAASLFTYKQMSPGNLNAVSNSSFKFHNIQSNFWLVASGNLHANDITKLEEKLKNESDSCLILDDPKVSNSDLKYLKRLPLLALDISGTKVSDSGLSEISEIPGLKALIINNDKSITDTGTEVMSTMPLVVLALSDTSITDEGVERLSRSKLLLCLDVSNNKSITRKSLESLAQLGCLKALRIGGTSISGSDLRLLSGFQLFRLSVADLDLTDQDLEPLTKLQLRKLDISNNPRITDSGIKLIDAGNFVSLNVSGCPKVSKATLDAMQKRHPDRLIYSKDKPYLSSMDTELPEKWRTDRGREFYDPMEMLWAGAYPGSGSGTPNLTDKWFRDPKKRLGK